MDDEIVLPESGDHKVLQLYLGRGLGRTPTMVFGDMDSSYPSILGNFLNEKEIFYLEEKLDEEYGPPLKTKGYEVAGAGIIRAIKGQLYIFWWESEEYKRNIDPQHLEECKMYITKKDAMFHLSPDNTL